jgi:hypothetical protein
MGNNRQQHGGQRWLPAVNGGQLEMTSELGKHRFHWIRLSPAPSVRLPPRPRDEAAGGDSPGRPNEPARQLLTKTASARSEADEYRSCQPSELARVVEHDHSPPLTT